MGGFYQAAPIGRKMNMACEFWLNVVLLAYWIMISFGYHLDIIHFLVVSIAKIHSSCVATTLTARIVHLDITSFLSPSNLQLCWR